MDPERTPMQLRARADTLCSSQSCVSGDPGGGPDRLIHSKSAPVPGLHTVGKEASVGCRGGELTSGGAKFQVTVG